jgi:hypothetical protein
MTRDYAKDTALALAWKWDQPQIIRWLTGRSWKRIRANFTDSTGPR